MQSYNDLTTTGDIDIDDFDINHVKKNTKQFIRMKTKFLNFTYLKFN